MKSIKGSKGVTIAMLATVLALMSVEALAFTTPATTTFGYAIYDTVVVKMIGGPLGWVGAAFLLIFGIANIMKQWLITVVCVVGATCIIKLPTILTSLGATVA